MVLLEELSESALLDESGFFPCQHHSTMVLHVHVSPGGWTIGLLVAAVQRCNLTPSIWSISQSIKGSRNPAVLTETLLSHFIMSTDITNKDSVVECVMFGHRNKRPSVHQSLILQHFRSALLICVLFHVGEIILNQPDFIISEWV
jgi:hypothetical protein